MDYYELGFSRRRDPPECCPTVDGKLAREWHAGRLEGLGLASEYGDEAVDNAFVLKTGGNLILPASIIGTKALRIRFLRDVFQFPTSLMYQ